ASRASYRLNARLAQHAVVPYTTLFRSAKLLAAMRSGVSGSWAMVKRATTRAITLISRVRSTLPQAGRQGEIDGDDAVHDQTCSAALDGDPQGGGVEQRTHGVLTGDRVHVDVPHHEATAPRVAPQQVEDQRQHEECPGVHDSSDPLVRPAEMFRQERGGKRYQGNAQQEQEIQPQQTLVSALDQPEQPMVVDPH